MSMDILELIEKHYPLKPLHWKHKNEVLETDAGTKRVRIWTDERTMTWHFNWREQLESNTLLTDRMIRTLDANWFLPFEDHFLTLHDERYEPFPKHSHEQTWGMLLGKLLSQGIEQPIYENEHFSETREQMVQQYGVDRSDLNIPILNRSLPEAKRRIRTVETIRNRYRHLKIPSLEPSILTHQGKRVHGRLFWQGGNEPPERSMYGLCDFLSDWRLATDTKSMYKLLDAIHDHFPLEGGYDQLLAADLIAPREVQRCVRRLDSTDDHSVSEILDQFEREWESNRTLVEEVCRWIEHRAKKVIR
ncbi:hypothetical protein [Pseudalkalibacillus salsuginis]|uniref:hypothetical protein n=1 Tax=Pseudalkalibacillus salsuginis TaxID=2910972 RepID=UPI001F3B6D29|nr:hypothetical protein [Pseudalkalibacillus salsuginis]MCF6408673.1 hypothetical protein [Pseudalkalibacillus salsuginis]